MIELGFVIAIFLGWQFVVGEYVGGILLILFARLFITLTNPTQLLPKPVIKKPTTKDDSDGSSLSDLLSLQTRHQWR